MSAIHIAQTVIFWWIPIKPDLKNDPIKPEYLTKSYVPRLLPSRLISSAWDLGSWVLTLDRGTFDPKITAYGCCNRKRIAKEKKKHNPIVDWLAYITLRVLVVFLYLFDVERNLNTACFLGRLLWKHYHRGRKRALDNLRASFPEKSEQWIWQTGSTSQCSPLM
ncbi:MAG: hypothetical protein ACYSR6_07520 [Planctomycetota bacterium]|jgi:hypothetical protein